MSTLRRYRSLCDLEQLALTRMRCVGFPFLAEAPHRRFVVSAPRKLLLAASLFVASFAAAGRAHAQPVATGLALDRFDPAERGSEWFVLDTLDLRGTARPAIGADFDWAHKPLLVY